MNNDNNVIAFTMKIVFYTFTRYIFVDVYNYMGFKKQIIEEYICIVLS